MKSTPNLCTQGYRGHFSRSDVRFPDPMSDFQIRCQISRFEPDFVQNRSVGLKTSFAKLVHDFDWKSIPATRKQKQGFRDLRFQILAQTPSFMKSPEKSLHTGLGGVRIKCEARFRDQHPSPDLSSHHHEQQFPDHRAKPKLSTNLHFFTFSFAYFGRGPLHRFLTLETWINLDF